MAEMAIPAFYFTEKEWPYRPTVRREDFCPLREWKIFAIVITTVSASKLVLVTESFALPI